jgi:AraC family transcriptional regulator, transcriptional activator of pobA
MSKEPLNVIQKIDIDFFNENDSGLLVIKLEDLFKKYDSIIQKPRRVSFYQIALITDGQGSICIDSFKYNFKPRSLLAVSNGQVIVIEDAKNIKGYAICFSEEYIYKYPDDLQWINSLKLFDPLGDSFLIDLCDSEFSELINTIKRIESEINTVDNYAKDEILINTIKTLVIISERIKRTKNDNYKTDDRNSDYAAQFRKKLEEHYRESRMVNFYAGNLSVTSKKLNRVTCSYFGRSVKQIIEERVILEIKRLLIHSNQSVKEIGCSLGFNDPTNFNKFFKKYMKLTPTEYRAQNK